jgi:hypothetical protein
MLLTNDTLMLMAFLFASLYHEGLVGAANFSRPNPVTPRTRMSEW